MNKHSQLGTCIENHLTHSFICDEEYIFNLAISTLRDSGECFLVQLPERQIMTSEKGFNQANKTWRAVQELM